MLDLNLNLYKEFYKVANSKSLGEASAKHNKSSVSFSKNIKELEDILGFALFYRTQKGMKLTKEGQEVYNYVDNALTSIDAGEKVVLGSPLSKFSVSLVTSTVSLYAVLLYQLDKK